MPAFFAVPHLQLPSMTSGAWNGSRIPGRSGCYQGAEPFSTDRLTHDGSASVLGFAAGQLGCLPA